MIFILVWLSNYQQPTTSSGFSANWDDCNGLGPVFNWHPLLMTVAFGTLFSQAVLHFRLLPYSHDVNKVFHMGTNTVAIILSSIALGVAVKCKSILPPYYSFYSLHSWLGIAAFSAFCAQYAAGFLSFFFPKFSESTRRAFLPYHKYFGICLYFLTMFALVSGITNRFFGSSPLPPALTQYDGYFTMANTYALSLFAVVCTIMYHHFTPKEKSLTVQVRDEDEDTSGYGRVGETGH